MNVPLIPTHSPLYLSLILFWFSDVFLHFILFCEESIGSVILWNLCRIHTHMWLIMNPKQLSDPWLSCFSMPPSFPPFLLIPWIIHWQCPTSISIRVALKLYSHLPLYLWTLSLSSPMPPSQQEKAGKGESPPAFATFATSVCVPSWDEFLW